MKKVIGMVWPKAMSTSIFIFFSLWFCLFSPSLSHGDLVATNSTSKDIYDLLPQYGFPKGLLPNNAISYTISTSDGFFTVQLESPCYVLFLDQLVYYHSQISGILRYGSVSHVSGIQAKRFFLWLPVTGIELHRDSGDLEFFVGAFSQTLPADQFQNVPDCSRKGCKATVITNLVDRF